MQTAYMWQTDSREKYSVTTAPETELVTEKNVVWWFDSMYLGMGIHAYVYLLIFVCIP
jgi:hypothetical protein